MVQKEEKLAGKAFTNQTRHGGYPAAWESIRTRKLCAGPRAGNPAQVRASAVRAA